MRWYQEGLGGRGGRPSHKLSLGSSCASGGREGLEGAVLQEQALSVLLFIHIPSEQSWVRGGGFKEIDTFHIVQHLPRWEAPSRGAGLKSIDL